ncbi:ATP-binding protein [Cytophagaceae bacterium DM2B3-1]|uniref:ATP-binding protein n=1 Tax=Xanthocytophaga flava TaxID=3048013 RepID=A0ABT7CN95_9BACT|nr:ATP-binding protein [Xanthocytophaga flavus]MDJ1495021.1 ATP-binding protein [Xanthocytophaga flavus]
MPTRKPEVNQANEFKEIANDFTNPLELIREAISNSFDAKAQSILLNFEVVNVDGEDIFMITIKDDGDGMDEYGLVNFFDLGNSSRRNDPNTIGEKGHGTKVYFNSKKLTVRSIKEGKGITAVMNNIFQTLNRGDIPEYSYEYGPVNFNKGTEITILGYNQSRYGLFTHEQIKDYILWRTKFGSIEKVFDHFENKDVLLHFKGLDSSSFETISFGHFFPKESLSVEKLFEQYPTDSPDYFCKKWIKTGHLPNFPHIKYEAVFYVEGKYVKYDYNKMLRRQGYQPPEGAYIIQDRYGLWLCKDFIPIQRKNDWIVSKGSEYTRFHAFFNCQHFKLTANRGSVENTNHEYLKDIESVVKDIHKNITESDDYSLLDWLETEVKGYTSKAKEKKEFERRKKNAIRQNIAIYKGHKFVEPELESGVYALVTLLNQLEPDLFPFEIIDYNTNTGIDILVKEKNELTLENSRFYYVELKNILQKRFNHSFEYIHSIICWDTDVKDSDEIEDLENKKRRLTIVNPTNDNDYTRYFLDDPKSDRRIVIYVLKDYLKQRLNIDFRPRNSK